MGKAAGSAVVSIAVGAGDLAGTGFSSSSVGAGGAAGNGVSSRVVVGSASIATPGGGLAGWGGNLDTPWLRGPNACGGPVGCGNLSATAAADVMKYPTPASTPPGQVVLLPGISGPSLVCCPVDLACGPCAGVGWDDVVVWVGSASTATPGGGLVGRGGNEGNP